jgi:hypothetical protein
MAEMLTPENTPPTFYDDAGRPYLVREMSDGSAWLCYQHPDGQWVSLRKATPLEYFIKCAIRDVQPVRKEGTDGYASIVLTKLRGMEGGGMSGVDRIEDTPLGRANAEIARLREKLKGAEERYTEDGGTIASLRTRLQQAAGYDPPFPDDTTAKARYEDRFAAGWHLCATAFRGFLRGLED